MSVQAGIWNFDGRPVDHKLLADISESLKPQGPDGEFCHLDGSVALLYRPFHTTAESRRENQPYRSHRGFIVTWDGRLDNRDELIPELHRELDADPTDVAIVAAAFDRWETDCFRRIIGDWAVSIWKPDRRELIFAADYMTIRHIFYYLTADRVLWSTDLSSLVLLSGDKFVIDDDYIGGYFANDPDSHLTPYDGIYEVPAGQYVRICNGRALRERHWRFGPRTRIRYQSDTEYEEHFRHIFRQSVRRRLRSDSPVLAELSGGLDSSSIVCMADDILALEGAETSRLDTLSFYNKTEQNGDDWIFSQQIENKRGRLGAHIDASKYGESASLEYPDFAPLPGCLGAANKIETERADVVRSGGYKTVLSGIGGDEFLGGNPDPRSLLADLLLQFKLITLAGQLVAWSLVKRRPWIHLLGQALTDLLPPSLGQYFVKTGKVEPWVKKEFARRTKIAKRQLDVPEHFGLWLPTRRSYIGGVQMLANRLAKCMPPILALEETRYPFLDQSLVEFILSIPASQLLRPGERRSLMRRSLVRVVPEEVLSRRTKQFAARTPVIAIEKHWEELRSALESSLASRFGYIDQKRFLEELSAARNGRAIHITKMLKTVSLEFWLRALAIRGLLAGKITLQQLPTAKSLHSETFHHMC
jgi:asparagine synthase (glutamine-hydrolysing)